MESKYCSKCYLDKPSSDYHKRKVSLDGLQDKCKGCSRISSIELRKARLDKNPDHDKKIKQAWYKENRVKSIERA